jgi:hypothetical protein
VPTLRIAKNGRHICTIGSAGIWMFSIHAWADVWSEPATHLDITGGRLQPDGKDDFLIWEMDHKLVKGDQLVFEFLDGERSSREPELFDDEKAKDQEPKQSPKWEWPLTAEATQEMESRPVKCADLVWYLSMNSSPKAPYRPGPGRQQMSLGLLWNSRRPDRMRVSLSSTSLREVIAREGGQEHVTEYVPIGTRVEFEVGA